MCFVNLECAPVNNRAWFCLVLCFHVMESHAVSVTFVCVAFHFEGGATLFCVDVAQ